VADTALTYTGSSARGRYLTDAGAVDFVRGETSTVSPEIAALLADDPNWSAPPKAAAPSAPEGAEPPKSRKSQGSTPKIKES
jgi:hypothetical protein